MNVSYQYCNLVCRFFFVAPSSDPDDRRRRMYEVDVQRVGALHVFRLTQCLKKKIKAVVERLNKTQRWAGKAHNRRGGASLEARMTCVDDKCGSRTEPNLRGVDRAAGSRSWTLMLETSNWARNLSCAAQHCPRPDISDVQAGGHHIDGGAVHAVHPVAYGHCPKSRMEPNFKFQSDPITDISSSSAISIVFRGMWET
jgi:hypothetical protein